MDRRKKQKLLKKLDAIVHGVKAYKVREIIRSLDAIIAGAHNQGFHAWVFMTNEWKRSRLIQRYYELSMDLTI